jgi:hypothetical protein
MPSRVIGHVRANVVGYLALFVALGGTSYAAIRLPTNSVKAAQIASGAVRSAEVKDRSLLAKDFKLGQLPGGARGPAGTPGAPGAPGPKGDIGAAGAPATRLWARVNTFPATPEFVGTSGVVSVVKDPGFPGTPGVFLITFDRDVSACAFIATAIGRGGGTLIPTPSIGINTGFYAGSGTTERQVRVSTYLTGARTALDFDVAAFC